VVNKTYPYMTRKDGNQMDNQQLAYQEDTNLTVPEAARYLRVSKAQLYAMIQRKEIPHTRVTEKRVIIRMRDLKAWLETRTGLPSRIS
jgi:excisionase family DNA binding protein